MRVKKSHDGLSVHAVAGTNVVLLGIALAPAKCPGLLGFALQRSQNGGPFAWLEASRIFPYAHDGLAPNSRVPTNEHPIQDFLWSDFTAHPGVNYKFRVVAMRGTPRHPVEAESVELEISTESPEGGDHDITFNRGAASSQQYIRLFGDQTPEAAGPKAWTWLSRGLEESILAYIAQANGTSWGLRVAAYEFTYGPVLKALSTASRKQADVKIIYHARERVSVKTAKNGKTTTTQAGTNRAAVTGARIKSLCQERQAPPQSAISHNKFIVLLKDGAPVSVLTGSTNFTQGGIFGHSNLVHIVQDPAIAAAYLEYWELLSHDPATPPLASDLDALCPIPSVPPPKGTSLLFSPRSTNDALDLYQSLAHSANDALFMTFAFGMNPLFQDVYANGKAPLRYALLEKLVLALQDKDKEAANRKQMEALARKKENEFAVGAFLPSNAFDIWLKEKLTGLNPNVKYLHTKYMLIDPLSPDPIIVSGSANFSENSCTVNDENMLIVRGNTRVADIYLGEFMRLHRHYQFREWAAAHPAELANPKPEFLKINDSWWKPFFKDSTLARSRSYFA